MTAPQSIIELVQRFDEHREAYRSGKYNEAQLRVEFLNPFFEALGWDVLNRRGYALDYREVITEDSIAIEGQAKAPDYAFKIGRERKFFVEAKKPSVDIAGDIHPAYQLRRYAWNVHLPLSILTDFEEFAVYDCRSTPHPTDSAATGRTMFLRYTQFIEKWDEIAGIFSREAVLKGSFDQYALESKGKKGTTEVDDEFLKSIEAWRTLLARNIALRNPQVADEQQLNYAVQMTIDRIIFLRICEDRAIEPENQLQIIAKTPEIYSQLAALFLRADLRYNSGLFHFKNEKEQPNSADTFTPTLKIDDRVLKEIINSMYYPCPYIFKEIPVEILGQVYEQFLGKVIRLTAGHQAKVEEKPEVRKAGGVYYTPSYIVKYIVQNTVGKLLEGKTPAEAADLKIVDPACGSGSFLLGAYQYLLDWHEDWYAHHEPEKWAKGKNPLLVQVNGGSWRLTTHARKSILVNNIHGVDIDPQAVEVTKLSLLLKVLEEESGQLSFKFERILPDLGNNIQCGNSLIGPDYFEGRLVVDESERRRVNALDWQRAFPQVFEKGGFDAVIGNPPYGADLKSEIKKFLIDRYPMVSDFETSQYFIVISKKILRQNGFLSFIIPNTLFLNMFAKKFRSFVLMNYSIDSILNLSSIDVFEGATVRTVIPFFVNTNDFSEIKFFVFQNENEVAFRSSINQRSLVKDDFLWIKALGSESNPLQSKIKGNSVVLGDILDISQGLIPYDKYRGHSEYTIKNRIWNSDHRKDDSYKKELRGGDIQRYSVKWNGKQWISYGPWLAAPRKPKYFIEPRLLFREITDPKTKLLHVAYCDEEFYNNPGILNCVSKGTKYSLYYLLGICASKLLSFYHFSSSPKANKGLFPKILVNDVRKLPIRTIDFSNPADVKRHDRMVALVQRMLELHKQTPATPFEQERLARDINATDAEIDRLVYELYELTPEEVKIVEG